MKLINLFDEVINGNISEDVVFEMYGEKFQGINELGYEKGLSRELLLGEVKLIKDDSKEEIQEEDEGIEKLIHDHEEPIDIWLIKETINEIIDYLKVKENKKIENIGNDYYHKTQDEINQIFQRKINEIIDKINGEE